MIRIKSIKEFLKITASIFSVTEYYQIRQLMKTSKQQTINSLTLKQKEHTLRSFLCSLSKMLLPS